jgi:hypothetical protein
MAPCLPSIPFPSPSGEHINGLSRLYTRLYEKELHTETFKDYERIRGMPIDPAIVYLNYLMEASYESDANHRHEKADPRSSA